MTIADFDLASIATALYIYPVKSCAGLRVEELALDARGGAVGDRGWAIVNAQDEITWQGAFARLALVRPGFQGGRLRLAADGFDAVDTPADDDLAPCQVKLWNELTARHDVFDAADAGPAVAAWLAQVVGAPLRLVKLGQAACMRENNNALHIVFAASVAAGEDGIEFIEENLEALDWLRDAEATRLEITAPCVRCVVPNVDPESGGVEETVLDTLARMSRERRGDGTTVFGVYARGPVGARLRVGDSARMTLAF